MIHKLVGRRVKLATVKEVFPEGIFKPGLTGKISFIDSRMISVKLDDPHEGLSQWNNKLHWYDHELEPEDCLLDEFLNQVELI